MTTRFYDAQYDGARFTLRAESVSAGDVAILRMPQAGLATIVVAPTTSSTITIECTASSPARVNAGTALWVPNEGLAAGGVCQQKLMDTISSTVTAIRATFSGAGGAVEISQ